jgi:uncharacterized protein YdeI (YjbR/CyaY-like superfamily)
MNQKVDDFIQKAENWQDEYALLRRIVLECGLNEELKWRVPCYTFQNGNVLLIHGFKAYVAIAFFKGVLLSDPDKILIQQTENVQSARQIRFKDRSEILQLENTIKSYIFEAIEVEKSGLKVELKKNTDLTYPEELEDTFKTNSELKTAFEALTPGRQKGYLLFFSVPKQSKTIISRIENAIPRILSGKGLNDCTCGLSKKMPNCDGSHKSIKG